MINGRRIIKYYIMYFFAILAPQILMISNKGSTFDTLYKAFVLICFILVYFMFLKSTDLLYLSRNSILWLLLYVSSSIIGIMYSGNLGLYSLFLTGIICIVFICFIAFPANMYIKRENVNKFTYVYILLIVYACVFNFVKNGTSIVASVSSVGAGNFSSFFDNKNTYGLFLFCGIIGCCLCINSSPQKWFPRLALFLIFANLLVCASRTALFASVGYIVIYYVLANGKSIYAWLTAIVVVLFVYYLSVNVDFVSTFLTNHVFRNDSGLLDRNTMAEVTLDNISGIGWLFGYGENASSYMAQYTGYAYFHNTFIEIMATGGIVKALLYLALIIKSFIVSTKIFRHYSKKIGAVFMAAWIAYFIYSFGESVVILNGDTQGFIMTIFLLTLPQLYYNSYNIQEKFYDGEKK